MAALLNVCFGLLPENAGEEESFEAFKLAEVHGTMVVDDMGKCTLFMDGQRVAFFEEALEAADVLITAAAKSLDFDKEAVLCMFQTIYNEDVDPDDAGYMADNLEKEMLIIDSLHIDPEQGAGSVFCSKVQDTLDGDVVMSGTEFTVDGEPVNDPNEHNSRAHEYKEMTVLAVPMHS